MEKDEEEYSDQFKAFAEICIWEEDGECLGIDDRCCPKNCNLWNFNEIMSGTI